MKVTKEMRQMSKDLLRASFVDGQLDQARVGFLVTALIEKKPRNYRKVLDAYKRLLRLEIEKRSATVESATEIDAGVRAGMTENLKTKYGHDVATTFVVNPELLGGMRIRVGSDVWDSSVRNRLQLLQQQL